MNRLALVYWQRVISSSHLISMTSVLSLSILVLTLAKLVTLLKDVVGQVVNWISRPNPVHINHALSKDRDDLLHQELSHVELACLLQLLNVCLN